MSASIDMGAIAAVISYAQALIDMGADPVRVQLLVIEALEELGLEVEDE